MLPDFINMLSWWQWAVLAMVPPAIVALYFLKLKRRPLEVPSTYLWHRSIEDLRVNTIWQRLRRNLLLFLQLLLVLLAMLAVLRPGYQGAKLSGDRFIFLIDNSASMQATDVEDSRLAEAKRAARGVIELMKPHDVAMIVSFADTARVEQMFTDNRRQLLRGLEKIKPTERATSLAEALKVASGLANPGRSANDATDVQVAQAMPATLYIFSDGKFPETNLSLGNLEPVYRPVGSDTATNVGVAIFTVRRNESQPDRLQAFARVENYSAREASVSLELWLDKTMIDAAEFQVAAGASYGFERDLGTVDSGLLRLKLTDVAFAAGDGTAGDQLALDNQAWAVIGRPRPANVLLVTAGDEALEFALTTELASQLATLTIEPPAFLRDEKSGYQRQAAAGAYDLVIYDDCRPKTMPQANTFFIGTLPPVEIEKPARRKGAPPVKQPLWKAGAKVTGPRIIDVDPSHPLTQWLQLDDVLVAGARPLEVPASGSTLIDSHLGPLLAIAPREEFEDLVLAFPFVEEFVSEDGSREKYVGTNWPIRPSFPIFVLNLLQYFSGEQSGLDSLSVRCGEPVTLENPLPGQALEVRTPGGERVKLPAGGLGKVTFGGTAKQGVYQVRSRGKTINRFAVNMFRPSESEIGVRREIRVGHVAVKGQSDAWQAARRELWKWILLAGLVVLMVEWYVYHRRVYV